MTVCMANSKRVGEQKMIGWDVQALCELQLQLQFEGGHAETWLGKLALERLKMEPQRS